MPNTLYEVSSEMELIVSQLEEMELSEAQIQESIDAFLEANEEFLRDKLDDYCKVIVNKDADAEVKRSEAKALVAMAQQSERTRDMLKERCKLFFERAGIKKYPTEHFAPKVCGNGGLQPLKLTDEVIQDPTLLPSWAQKVVPDLEAIRNSLDGTRPNAPLDGIAWLEERGTHFRVR